MVKVSGFRRKTVKVRPAQKFRKMVKVRTAAASSAAASSATAGDDEVEVVFERTRKERDAELRAEAVALESNESDSD